MHQCRARALILLCAFMVSCASDPGACEIDAFSAVDGDSLWSTQLAAESAEVWATECTGDELQPDDCHTGVVALAMRDNCDEKERVRGVEALSGRSVPTVPGLVRRITGDQRVDASWALGRTACSGFGDVEPYLVRQAPIVQGVCCLVSVVRPRECRHAQLQRSKPFREPSCGESI
jgi:hypothetical protein